MTRIHRRLATIACAGLLAPLALSTPPAGAVDQDLVVSATSGAPGDEITVSSASCSTVVSGDEAADTFLRVLLISGDGADAVLAGAGSGNGTATLIVPDWLDPSDPAVIEASCITVDFDGDDFEEVAEPFDPVAFDVLPGVGAPTQTAAYSRTELLTGQSFAVDGTGCTSGPDAFGAVDLLEGGDLSGRSFDRSVAGGGDSIDAGTFHAQVDLIERSWGYGWSSSNDGLPEDIQVHEDPTDIPPGTYTAVPYCGRYDESTDTSRFVMLPPSLIEVTGTAPITEVSLEVPAGTKDITFEGLSCTVGDVTGSIGGVDLVAEQAELPFVRVADDRYPSPFGPTSDQAATARTRAVGHEEWVPFAAVPSADGSWTVHETAGFDIGVVTGDGQCGDPMADGFFYDLRLAVVDVPPAPTTTIPTTTTIPSGAAPADAIPGSPAYAG